MVMFECQTFCTEGIYFIFLLKQSNHCTLTGLILLGFIHGEQRGDATNLSIHAPWKPTYLCILSAVMYRKCGRCQSVLTQTSLPFSTVMVLLIVTMRRRRKEPLILEEERDIRENIVRYDDEGGGEEDTEAFDMVTLRNLNVIRDPNVRRDVTPDTPTFFHYTSATRPPYKSLPDNVVFREFIWERLKDADVDPSAPPYDSLQTYAFEGSGSVAESLSSLESLSTDSDQNYDYLANWGPRFKKLADLYGNSDGTSVFS